MHLMQLCQMRMVAEYTKTTCNIILELATYAPNNKV